MTPEEIAASVVIPAFNERQQIDGVLASLYKQDLKEPFEIIVVASGDDDCVEHLRSNHPSTIVVESRNRLLPGAARNAGVRKARGQIVAFASADTRAAPVWLSDRLRVHREGFDLVGGSILNGTPESRIGTANYLLEYSALMPTEKLLAQQDIPHAVSFKRSVFELIGLYPEHLVTGEDTVFNRRCINAGLLVGYAPAAGLFHENPTHLGELLRHAATHGQGLAQCIEDHDLQTAYGIGKRRRIDPFVSGAHYVVVGLLTKYKRIASYAPQQLPTLIISTPLIFLALIATAYGTVRELKARNSY